MAALTTLILFGGVTLVRTIAFLIIALVSLRKTRPVERPAILRSLAMLVHWPDRKRIPRR
jgi:hypothetical protein